jgi:hypothetical protein
VPGDGFLPAAGQGLRVLGVELGQRGEHRVAVGRELLAADVKGRAQRRHRAPVTE